MNWRTNCDNEVVFCLAAAPAGCLGVVSWQPNSSLQLHNLNVRSFADTFFVFCTAHWREKRKSFLQFYLMSFRVVRRLVERLRMPRTMERKKSSKASENLFYAALGLVVFVLIDSSLVNYKTRVENETMNVEWSKQIINLMKIFVRPLLSTNSDRSSGAELLKNLYRVEGKKWKSFARLFVLVLAAAKKQTKVHLENYLWSDDGEISHEFFMFLSGLIFCF